VLRDGAQMRPVPGQPDGYRAGVSRDKLYAKAAHDAGIFVLQYSGLCVLRIGLRHTRGQQKSMKHDSTNAAHGDVQLHLPRNSMMEPRSARKATEPMKVTPRYSVGSLLSKVIRRRLSATATAAHASIRYQFLHESPNITLTRVCRQQR